MPEVKQSFEIGQQTLTKAFVSFAGSCRQKFYIPNQMFESKLLKAIGVLDVGTVKVADDRSAVGSSENLLKNLGASR